MSGLEEVDQLLAAGFSDAEVQQHISRQRQTLTEAGFSDVEVDAHFGVHPIDDAPIQKWVDGVINDAKNALADPAAAVGTVVNDAKNAIVGPATDVDTVMGDDLGADVQRPELLPLLEAAVKSGYQNSVVGLASRGELPDVTVGEDAPFVARIAEQASGLALDLPIMVGGAVFGAVGGTATLGPGVGTVAGAGAGAFVLPATLRKTLMMAYQKGGIKSAEDFIDRTGALLLTAAQSAAVGASTTTAGSLATGPLNKFAAELTTLVTVSKGLEGEVPSFEDFAEGAVIIFGMKSSIKVAGAGVNAAQRQKVAATKVLQDVYAKTGKTPADIVRDAQTDPTIIQDVMALMHPNSAPGTVPRSYQRLAEGGGVELPPKPTVVSKAVGVLSAAQQTVRDRISVGEKEAPTTFKESVDNIYTHGIDKLYPLAQLVETLKAGDTLAANKDPYKGARFLPAATAKAQLFLDYEVRKFGTNEVVSKGLKQVLEPVKDDLDGIRIYSTAKRNIELSERDVPVVTGIDVSASRQVVKEGAKKYQRVFEELVQYQNAVTSVLKDSGVISEKMFNKMMEANKDYMDFHRFFDPQTTTGVGRGTRARNPIKAIRGSERKILDPLESVIKNTYLYTTLADRNSVNLKLVELAEARGGTGEGSLVSKVKQPRVPTTIDAAEMQKISKQVEAEFGIKFTPEELTIFRARTLQPTDTQFVVFRDGKRELYEVDREVGIAMNGLDAGSANMLVKLLSAPAKTLRAGAILSPEFFVKNMMRDTVSSALFSTAGFRPVLDTMLGGLSLVKKDTAFRDWMMSGGANATMVSLDRQYLQGSLRKISGDSYLGDMKKLNDLTGLWDRTINVVKSPLEVLRVGSELAENATRLGAFKRKTRGDRSQESLAKGGFESREVTLDFARIGASTQALNQMSAFLNARLQGYDRAVRGALDNPLRVMGTGVATITLPSVALWMANHDDPRYKQIPQWQKDMSWLIMTEDTVWRIPKPFEPGFIFGSIPERVLDAWAESDPGAAADMAKKFLKDVAAPALPNAFAPIVENITNYSFFKGGPVVPSRLEGDVPGFRYTEYTTEVAKKIGQITGSMGVTPIDVENYVRQWSGGLGTYALKLADMSLRKSGVLPDPPRPADTLSDIPFVRAFVVRHPSAGAQPILDFYKDSEREAQLLVTFKRLVTEGDEEGAAKVQTLSKGRMLDLSGIRSSLGSLSSVARMIYRNPDMPRDEKRQLIDQTYNNMSRIAEEGNKIMKDRKD